MDQGEVFDLIDIERDYQDGLGTDRTSGNVHTVGEELVVLEYCVRQALDKWVENPGDERALAEVCKVAAVAVRCLENWCDPGTKFRDC